MKDAASIGELASYSSEQTSWVKTEFKKIKDKLSRAVTSFISEVSCCSFKSIGILSPHKRPKRGCPPTTRLKSTVEKYGKSTRKGRGKEGEKKLMWTLYLKLNQVPPELSRKIRIYRRRLYLQG